MIFAFLASMLVMLGGGAVALLTGRWGRVASWIATVAVIGGAAVAVVPTMSVLSGGPYLSYVHAWQVPMASFRIELDRLSAFFVVPVLVLGAIAAVYGTGYLRHHSDSHRGCSLGAVWFFYNLLIVSMMLVLTARNGVLFLVAWEVMSLASYFLVTFEHERTEVRQAGWTYLVATHLGTLFLLVLFVLMGQGSSSLDFDQFVGRPWVGGGANLLFLLALVGFGTKAGLMPMHVWLPEAHPAAPSHVSAIMSGVMIKTGIYGLLRMLLYFGDPPAWWGGLLIGIGLLGAVLGILLAMAQSDLKRVLAYSSIENIGIICTAIGLALLGQAMHMPILTALGFAGALLHVWNHALFKGLLFMAAGSVLHGAGTLNLNRLGGLMKRMPWTGTLLVVGSVAIVALPPLNGFVSEFVIYLGAIHAVDAGQENALAAAVAIIGGLAVVGALAAACMSGVIGVSFLGEPRTESAAHAHDCAWSMRIPMLLLAAGCFAVGLLAPWLLTFLSPVVASLSKTPTDVMATQLAAAVEPLRMVQVVMVMLLSAIMAAAMLRFILLWRKPVRQGLTWDCGYARPTARMQYTAASFTQPITAFFSQLLHSRRHSVAPTGYFPQTASLTVTTPDWIHRGLYRRAFAILNQLFERIHWVQQGRVQLYVLYIAVTLLVLLFWKLG